MPDLQTGGPTRFGPVRIWPKIRGPESPHLRRVFDPVPGSTIEGFTASMDLVHCDEVTVHQPPDGNGRTITLHLEDGSKLNISGDLGRATDDARDLAHALVNAFTLEPQGPSPNSPDGLPDNLDDFEQAEDQLYRAINRARGCVTVDQLIDALQTLDREPRP